MTDKIRFNRNFMKGYAVEDFEDAANDFSSSDQKKGIAPPSLQKEYDKGQAKIFILPDFDESTLAESNIINLIRKRRSRRHFKDTSLSQKELSYLLWATQGVVHVQPKNVWTRRTVPSAGGRHPYETYLVINRVVGLAPGIYRYLGLSHELLFLFNRPSVHEDLFKASYGEQFVAEAPVCFIWSCVPYRGEWRYNTKSHKSMLLDAGHLCQNLYLAAEAIGCGTCAIGGYYQQGIDQMLELDGETEFVVYLAPVGKQD